MSGVSKRDLKTTLTFPRKCLRYSLAVGSLSSFTLTLQGKGTSERVGLERLWLVPSIQQPPNWGKIMRGYGHPFCNTCLEGHEENMKAERSIAKKASRLKVQGKNQRREVQTHLMDAGVRNILFFCLKSEENVSKNQQKCEGSFKFFSSHDSTNYVFSFCSALVHLQSFILEF